MGFRVAWIPFFKIKVYENEKSSLQHLDYNAPCLFPIVLIKLIYIDVLIADIENKVPV